METAAPLRTAKEARAVFEHLRADGDRFGARLRALEAHPGYRRLRTMPSSGATLRAWEQTRTSTDELLAQLRAYRSTLERADALFTSRTRLGRDDLAELNKILQGPVDLPPPPHGPAEPRNLTALMAQMTTVHADVLRTVTDVDEYSTTLQKRLNQLGDALRSLHSRVIALAFHDDGAASLVEGLSRELAEVSPIVLSDPLGCMGGTVDRSEDPATEAFGAAAQARLRRLSTAVDNAQTYMSTVRAQHSELSQSVTRLRGLITEVEADERECRRVEHEVRARITQPPVDGGEDAGPGLRQRLSLLERRRVEGQWSRLAELIREIEQGCAAARGVAGGRRAAAQALLDQRDELRGRLESYRAMAIGYGHAEDLDLTDAYERAYQLLWTAPCDLHQAGASVARYQRAVIERTESSGADGPGREVAG